MVCYLIYFKNKNFEWVINIGLKMDLDLKNLSKMFCQNFAAFVFCHAHTMEPEKNGFLNNCLLI
jgi:hypothetical protein